MRIHGSWTAPAVIVMALATTMSLTACGSDAPPQNTGIGKGTGPVKDPASPQTVTFFSWVGN